MMQWQERFSTFRASAAKLRNFLLGCLHHGFSRFQLGTSANANLILTLQPTADIRNPALSIGLSSLTIVPRTAPSPLYMDVKAINSGKSRSFLGDIRGLVARHSDYDELASGF
jgi:hypothetical protein